MNQSAPTASANAAAPQPKPIRFVTNHDGPYAKRRRINSACLTCRRKKTRCSGEFVQIAYSTCAGADFNAGERPVCSTCVNNKHECAGYGDDGANDSKKPVRRESNATNNAPRRLQQPIDPQLTRPPVQQTVSTMSQRSDSTNSHILKREDDGGSSNGVLSLSTRNRMPYFRYFGPTAIMPGFKQMVVKVRGKQHGSAQTASDRTSPPCSECE